jgi:transposase
MSVIMSVGRFGMEILSGVERRRRWRLEEKLRIVAEAEAPGSVFAHVARRHDVSRGQLWTWRHQLRRGELTRAPVVPEFLPVRVLESEGRAEPQVKSADKPMDAPASCAAPSTAQAATFGTGRIEIILPDGTCVRVDDQVGTAALRQVMAVLRG